MEMPQQVFKRMSHSTIELPAGASLEGNYNQIRSVGPVIVRGNHNKLATHNSEIHGNYNYIYGDNNFIQGNHNNVYGLHNLIEGSYNKEQVPQQRQQQQQPNPVVSNNNGFGNITTMSQNSNFKGSTCVLMHPDGTKLVIHSGDKNGKGRGSIVYHPDGTTTEYPGQTSFENEDSYKKQPAPTQNLMFTNNQGMQWVQPDGTLSNTRPNNSATKQTVLVIEDDEEEEDESFPKKQELKYDEVIGENENGDNVCVICLERKRQCVIRPCKHFSLCVTCSTDKLGSCPVCRVKITSIERVFK